MPAALPDLPAAGSDRIEIEGRSVEVTSLDKVLWPRAGFTKRRLLGYYLAVAPALLPHLAGRALTLGRWPGGVDARGFAQTECRGRPEWMRTAEVRLRGGELRRQCMVEDLPSLLWVANQNAIELHAPLHRAASADRPTHALLDLDPGPGAGLLDCCRVALEFRAKLEARGLTGWAKTTGSAGLHVHVELGEAMPYAEVRRLVAEVAGELADEKPSRVASSQRLDDRRRRVLV